MPNFASVMKEEVVRLARKATRAEIESIKKASSQYRADIAALKRRVAALEKQLAQAEKKSSRQVATEATDESNNRVRFSAKGLVAHRKRLGISAAEMGTLLGVSAQSVYHWESGKSKPRQSQLAAIAALRKMGKKEARAKLGATEA